MLPPAAYDIAGLALLGALAWLVWDSLRAREAALAASRAACSAQHLQLLDYTVALRRLRVARDRDGRLKLWRNYAFEYTDTGDNRRDGSVVVLGAEVVLVHIGEHSTIQGDAPRRL